MRLSNYNIMSSPLPDGSFVLLNGLTGLTCTIDNNLKALLNQAEDNELDVESVLFSSEIMQKLHKGGFITNLTEEEECALAIETAKKIDRNLHDSNNEPEYSLMLIPNYSCNFRCPYCFERGNEYDGGIKQKKITKELVDTFFCFAKSKRSEKSVTLYGGEPLCKGNREIIDYIVSKGVENGFYFFAITNGFELDSYLDLLGSRKIEFLQITLDGPEKIHNKRRVSVLNVPTYRKILENIRNALDISGVSIYIRINIDQRNAPYLKELYDDLNQFGILGCANCRVIGGIVTGAGNNSITYEEVEQFFEPVYEKFPNLRYKSLDISNWISLTLTQIIENDEPLDLQISGCGATERLLVFAPDGLIYPCGNFVGRGEYAVGSFNVEEGVVWNCEKRELWNRSKVYFSCSCMKCKYALICAGGCHKYTCEGKKNEPIRCEYYKKEYPNILANVFQKFPNAIKHLG